MYHQTIYPFGPFFPPVQCRINLLFVGLFFYNNRGWWFLLLVCVMKSTLTSAADGGQSSCFASAIRAAELSLQRSAGVRPRRPRCRSPGARQQTHKLRSKIAAGESTWRFNKRFVVLGFATVILFFFRGKKRAQKLVSCQIRNCRHSEVQQKLKGFDSSCGGERPRAASVHKQRNIPCLTITQHCSFLAPSCSAHQQGKTWQSSWSFCPPAELGTSLSCCMTSRSTWVVILYDSTDILGAPIQFGH